MGILKKKWIIKHVNGLYIVDKAYWGEDITEAIQFDELKLAEQWVENNPFIDFRDIITFEQIYIKE